MQIKLTEQLLLGNKRQVLFEIQSFQVNKLFTIAKTFLPLFHRFLFSPFFPFNDALKRFDS